MTTYIFIRHGEKIETDLINLSAEGKTRAKKLADYFVDDLQPTVLVAMRQRKPDSSNRSYQTVIPISQKLNLDIHNQFLKNDIKKLIEYLKTIQKGIVIVVWEHDILTKIIKKITGVKIEWDSDDYSSTYVFKDNTLKCFQQFEPLN